MMETWSPSACSSTTNLSPSASSAFSSGLISPGAIFMENSWDGFLASLRKQMKLLAKLAPTSRESPSSKFHPTTSLRFMRAREWWKLMAVGALPFWPIRQVPELLPQALQNSFSRTTDSWQSPTKMLPEIERSILTRTSCSPQLKHLPPTAAKRCPECDTLVAVRRSAEMLRYGCLAEWEKQSSSGCPLRWGLGLDAEVCVGLRTADWLPRKVESGWQDSSMRDRFLRGLACWLRVRFLKMLFILATSSLLASACCFSRPSSATACSTTFSTVIASPSSFYSPNYRLTNSANCASFCLWSSRSRSASSSPGRWRAREVRLCPWCSSCRQSTQASWLRPRAQEGYRHRPVTIYPRCDYLRVQQYIYTPNVAESQPLNLKAGQNELRRKYNQQTAQIWMAHSLLSCPSFLSSPRISHSPHPPSPSPRYTNKAV